MALQEELKKQGDFLFKHRSYLPLVLIIVGLWIIIYQEKFIGEENAGIVAEILKSTSIFIGIIGVSIRVFTVGYSPRNTSGRNTEEGQVADILNTTGIYSIIRNPLYLGNYLMWLAIAMLTGNIWFVLLFSLIFWIYYERIVYAEESFLRNKFGSTYLEWASKTPVFLPTKFNYIKPKISFSLRKVAKNEKNGLFALFLLFWVFKTVRKFAENGKFIIEERWITIGAISTGVLYIILKYLKKYTQFLDEEGR